MKIVLKQRKHKTLSPEIVNKYGEATKEYVKSDEYKKDHKINGNIECLEKGSQVLIQVIPLLSQFRSHESSKKMSKLPGDLNVEKLLKEVGHLSSLISNF